MAITGRFQYDLRTLFVWFVILAILFGIAAFAYRIGGPVLPRGELRWIKEHAATKQEVLRRFGQPTSGYEGDDWTYQRAGNRGWVEISFSKDGRVNFVNDESP